jgi:hypothetical protein
MLTDTLVSQVSIMDILPDEVLTDILGRCMSDPNNGYVRMVCQKFRRLCRVSGVLSMTLNCELQCSCQSALDYLVSTIGDPL